MTLDISDTLAPDSDQLDAVDLAAGPRTFTVTKVVVREAKKKGDQPVDVYLAEFPRVWRPGKSMRRVLAACWGGKGAGWLGHRVRLYCDPTVKFGDELVGGTRVSHLSHLDEPRKKVPLLASRGKGTIWTVERLDESTEERIAAYKDAWRLTTEADARAAIEAEVAKLNDQPPATTTTTDNPALIEDAFPKADA